MLAWATKGKLSGTGAIASKRARKRASSTAKLLAAAKISRDYMGLISLVDLEY